MKEQFKSTIAVSLAEVFYYTFFLILLVAKCLGLYDGQSSFKLLLIIAVMSWAAKMWLTDYSVKELIAIIVLIGLGSFVYIRSGEKGALLYILMITGLKNISIKRVFIVGATAWSLIFVVFTWLNSLHILESPFKVHDKFGMGPVIRWGLGYSHPNVLHVSYLVLVMFLVYAMGEKYNWKHTIGFMLGNMLIFIYSLSSTGVIAVTIYLIMTVYCRCRKQLNILEKSLIQLIFPICVLFSLIAPLVLQGNLFEFVNNLTNTRLKLARYFLTIQPPTLFGTKVADLITSQLTMDNSYVNAFVTYGIVLFVMIVGMYIVLIYTCCKQQKKGELCVIMVCLIAGITEPFLFNTSFKNLSLLFVSMLLFDTNAVTRIRFSKYTQKTFEISIEKLRKKLLRLKKLFGQRKKNLIIAAVLGCIIGCVGFQVLIQEPIRILVPESACDVGVLQRMSDELESVILISSQPLQNGDVILGYVDEKMPMIVFKGNIIVLEQVRNLLCIGISCSVILTLLVFVLGLQERRKV